MQSSEQINDVRDALSRFIGEPSFPQTFLLTGSWGVGKTFLYRDALKNAIEGKRVARRSTAYCSLFGAESLDDIRDRIFESMKDSSAGESGVNNSDALQGKMAEVGDALARATAKDNVIAKAVKAVTPWIKKVPGIEGYAPLLRMATFAAVRDAIVCIDDLERRSDALSMKDILGMVSYLREERGCKVILIANEDVLDDEDKAELQVLREKVFDLSVQVEPPPIYALSIAVPNNMPFRDSWVSGVSKLNLTNIRILSRVIGMNEQLASVLADAPEATKRQAIATLLLFGTSFYTSRHDLPPEEFIVSPYLESRDEDPERKRWSEFLQQYGWAHADELDIELLGFVRSGFFSTARMKARVDQAKRLFSDQEARTALSKGWDPYHYTLSDNEGEVIESLVGACTKYASYLSPMNLDGAVRLLRELDASGQADGIVAKYIDANMDRKEEFNLDNYAFADQVRDEKLRQAFKHAFQPTQEKKDLREVLTRIAERQSWSKSDTEFLASSSVDQYRRFFEELKGEDLPVCIKAALQFARFGNASEVDKKIGNTAADALKQLAAASRINRIRLKRFGIVPADGAAL